MTTLGKASTPTGVLIILMTAPDAGEGERIAGALLDEGVIACANIVPGVVSLYRWQGEQKRDAEVLVVMKTWTTAESRAVARAQELHPYDVPEILALDVTGGAAPYLAWVEQECG